MKAGIISVCLTLLMTAAGVFAIDLTTFEYRAEVTVDSAAEYSLITLEPQIYNHARRGLADIRLADSDNLPVPYVLTRPKDFFDTSRYSVSLINRSTNDSNAALVTLDFGKQVIKNSIDVQTKGRSFRRPVKVEGSNDNIQFFTLVDTAFVFAVGDSDDSRFSTVDLPRNDYRYLRVTVTGMHSETEPPVISAVKASQRGKKQASRQPVDITKIERTQDEKTNSTVCVYDLAYRNLPLSEITLDIADKSFYMYITILGRDVPTRKVKINSEDNRERYKEIEVRFQTVKSGVIYRYTTAAGKKHENLQLSIPSGRGYRYLKIVIRNYDDSPLAINSVSAEIMPHQLLFPTPAAAITLYTGSKTAAAPKYDLARTLNKPLKVEAAKAVVARLGKNPIFGRIDQKPLPWTEQHKTLLLIILAAVALPMAIIIIKSLKSIQQDQQQGQ